MTTPATTQLAQPQARPATLAGLKIKKARPTSPRILLYGQGGVGKTTFAAGFPAPLFVCAENGLNSAALAGVDFVEPETWADFLQLLTDFAKSEYKTIVIDTLDALVAGIFNDFICGKFQREGAKGTELADFAAIQYGRGTVVAQQEIKQMLNRLDEINSAGKLVLILAHNQIKNFKNPSGDDYDTYQVKGNDKLNDIIKCWADEVYFAQFVVSLDRDGKPKGGKSRWLETENSAAWFAKSRFGLQGMEMNAATLLNIYRQKIGGANAQKAY